MRDIWTRIERCLQLLAPECHAALAPGATPEQIEQLEAMLGVELPADVRESWSIHDGSGDKWILPAGDLLSLRGIAEHWYAWHDLVENGELDDSVGEPDGPIQPIWWSLKWIPFAHNGGGDHWCIDTDPANGGTIGQVIDFGHDCGPISVRAIGFRQYLSDYADRLEAGAFAFDPEGIVEA